jgi:cytochrome c oxidase subunit II
MAAQRALLAAGIVVGIVVLGAGLALAQGVGSGPASVDGAGDGFGAPAAPIQRGINDLYYLILPIALVVGILVEALLLYAMVRFRGRGRIVESGEHERGHTKLEIAWTIPPAVILLLVGVLSAQTLGAIENPPAADFTVDVIASQFSFGFRYPGAEAGSPLSTILRIEEGRVVLLNVTATDVIHSFAIHSFGVKIDAIPGRINTYWLQADAPGSFQVQCMEYCGSGHAYMRTGVEVVARGTCPPKGFCPDAGAEDVSEADRVLEVAFPESGGNPWSARPETLTAAANQKLAVKFVNPRENQAGHNITVLQGTNGPMVGKFDPIVQPGGDASFLLRPPGSKDLAPLPAGPYTYYCSVPGHRQLGMEGELTVS